jgi:peptide/nickel transport system substrate-binding protein
MKQISATVLTIVFVCLCAGGCRGQSGILRSQSLHVASLNSPLTLNPLFLHDAASAECVSLLHPTLLISNPETLQVEPGLFVSWDVSEDNLTYTFTLHENIFWSDGVALTTDDVAFTLKTICHPDYTGWLYRIMQNVAGADNYRKNHLSLFADGEIDGVKILDKYTIQVRLDTIYAPFLTNLVLSPLPAHYLSNVAVADLEGHEYSRTIPVGAGPYLLVEWRPDEYIHVRANPNYYLGKARIENVYYRVIPNQETQLIELMAGNLDLVPTAVKVEDVAQLEADPALVVYKNLRLVYDYLGFNLKKENSPLSDRRIRQALSMVLDRQEIVDNLLLGYGEVAGGPIVPLHYAYDPQLKGYTADSDAARKLLLAAGYPLLELKLVYNAGNPVRENIALLFRERCAKVGVNIEVSALEWEAFLSALREGEYDIILLGLGTDIDPDLTFHWHSESPANYLGYHNPEVDVLLERGAATMDPAGRTRLYREAQRLIVDDAPMVWLYYRLAIHAASAKLLNFTPHPDSLFYNVHQWEFEQ